MLCVLSWSVVFICDSRDCSLPGSCVHGILQARILELLPFPSPRDLPNQGLNSGLLHCEWILYQLSYLGSPQFLLRVEY